MSDAPSESIAEVASRSAGARSTVARWGDWGQSPVRWRRVGIGWHLAVWSGDWTGPRDGRYSYLGLTRRAVRRRIRRELARWDHRAHRHDNAP